MKKISYLIIGLVIPVYASADTHPFFDSSRPEGYAPVVGIHAGPGVSTITQNYYSQIENCSDFFFTPGVTTVFGASVELPVRNFLSIGTGADFSISHYNWSMTVVEGSMSTVNTLYNRNTYRTLEIPLYLKFAFNISDKVQWTNQIGFYISQGISGKSKYRAYVSSTDPLGQSQVTVSNYERDYYKSADPVVNGNSRTDIGANIGTGLMFRQHWTLDIVFRAGFLNMARNNGVLDIREHNLAATFRFGYKF